MSNRQEQGSATVELVILAPVFFLLLALVVVAGRTQTARANVEGVAHAAARQITLARVPSSAEAAARVAAATSLHEGSPSCRTMGWSATLTPDDVTVTISCRVSLAGAELLPIPGSMTVSSTSSEVIDQLRDRS
jgi:Flp pilus assembly protein TadG